MTEQEPNGRPVVVGVGPMEVDPALAYAAEEAVRAGCGLHLVHAVPAMPRTPVARAVLREATCPVLLASPHPHPVAYRP